VTANRPSYGFARRLGATLVGHQDSKARVACRADASVETLSELRRHLGAPLIIEQLSDTDYDALLERLYADETADAEIIVEDLDEALDLERVAENLPKPEELLERQDDAPVIRLINALFTEAIRKNASDIHIEPFENRLAVRLRVDGRLKEVLSPNRALGPLLASRIKVMARLDIAEKRLPQDGRISLRLGGRPVDVRVSTLPSGHGERVVLRILDKQAGRLDLEQLGMDAATLARMEDLIRRPNGILLVTGPTGSGKTTTLYSVLSRLNDRSRNIMTVEDPIEYYIDGIGQTQVNTRVDLSFARGLRAILRQDPDVVMVGEIRDLETAQIAVQASLTGHLVLSTLHTNSAVGALTRLRDMGVEPFLLSSSLIGVLSQRLLRVLRDDTREAYHPTPEECARFDHPGPAPEVFRPTVGLKDDEAYLGRTGIYELVAMDDALRDMIHEGAGEHAIEQHAHARSPSLRQDGWRKILDGRTSVEEVLRVTREN
jgi:general secretion pathway protein E